MLTPFETNLSQMQMLFRENLTFFFYQKLKLTEVSMISSFTEITLEYFKKIETGIEKDHVLCERESPLQNLNCRN